MTTSSYESLSHAKWDGKYHVVFIPKGRKKALYGKIWSFLGPVLRELAGQRGSTILEGHMVQDHVHMRIRIPPKYAVAEVIGDSKGKGAIAVARQLSGRQRNFHGERFWARGYAVSTVGFEEEQIRAYIKHQEQLDAQGSDESGEFSQRDRGPWQPLGLLTTVKPPLCGGVMTAPKPWTGCASRSGGTATQCASAPTSIPAACKFICANGPERARLARRLGCGLSP